MSAIDDAAVVDDEVIAQTVRRFAVTLRSTTPILFHADDVSWADKMDQWRTDPANKKFSRAGDDRTPAWRWVGHVPHDGKVIAIPSDYLMSSFRDAGAMVLVPGGKSGKTFKSQTQSGMMVATPFIPLLVRGKPIQVAPVHALMKERDFNRHEDAVARLGFSLFVKRVKVGQTKHIRVRARFDDCSLRFELVVVDEQITLDVLRDIITYAGRYKGLGDWRPGGRTPGQYGMFVLESLEQVAA
jgi:hypothetical protein